MPKLLPNRHSLQPAWRITGGVFGLLLLLVVLGSYYFMATTDRLIAFAPSQSDFYIHLRGGGLPLDNELSAFPLEQLWEHVDKQINWNGQLSIKQLLPQLKEVAVWSWQVGERPTTEWGMALRFSAADELQAVAQQVSHTAIVSKKTLLAASSAEALEQLEQITSGQSLSLADTLEKNLLGRRQLTVYTDHNVYLSANLRSQVLHFKLSGSDFGSSVASQPIIENVPPNATAFFSGIVLSDIFTQWNIIQPQAAALENLLRESYEQIVGDDFSSAITLFSQPSDLVIGNLDSADELPAFVLAFSAVTATQFSELEELMVLITALAMPEQNPRVLPDGSSVLELTTQLDRWRWQEQDSLDQYTIKQLIDDAQTPNIFTAQNSQRLLLSNDNDLLRAVIKKQGSSPKQLGSECFSQLTSAPRILIELTDSIAKKVESFNLFPAGNYAIRPNSFNGLDGCYWQ